MDHFWLRIKYFLKHHTIRAVLYSILITLAVVLTSVAIDSPETINETASTIRETSTEIAGNIRNNTLALFGVTPEPVLVAVVGDCEDEGNQANCNAIPGCSWSGGQTVQCSNFSWNNCPSACVKATPTNKSCSQFNGNQTACDDTQGCTTEIEEECDTNWLNCSWSVQNCSQPTCDIQTQSTPAYCSCGVFTSQGQAVCQANGCTWYNQQVTQICTGQYPVQVNCEDVVTCTGTYQSGGSCTGTYQTGGSCAGDPIQNPPPPQNPPPNPSPSPSPQPPGGNNGGNNNPPPTTPGSEQACLDSGGTCWYNNTCYNHNQEVSGGFLCCKAGTGKGYNYWHFFQGESCDGASQSSPSPSPSPSSGSSQNTPQPSPSAGNICLDSGFSCVNSTICQIEGGTQNSLFGCNAGSVCCTIPPTETSSTNSTSNNSEFCNQSQFECVDNSSYRYCTAFGSWSSPKSCSANEKCTGGLCVYNNACEGFGYECSQSALCGAEGESISLSGCSNGEVCCNISNPPEEEETLLDDGSICVSSSQCSSGYCENYRCANPTVGLSYFNQNDPPWGNELLEEGCTLGSAICGQTITASLLNTWVGNYTPQSTINTYYPNQTCNGVPMNTHLQVLSSNSFIVEPVNVSLGNLPNYINAGWCAFVGAEYVNSSGQVVLESHYTLAVGVSNGQIVYNDPWFGQGTTLEEYTLNVQSISLVKPPGGGSCSGI